MLADDDLAVLAADPKSDWRLFDLGTFRARKRISEEEAEQLLRKLKDYVNLSYDGEPAIAARIEVAHSVLNRWLRRKSQTD